MIKVFAEAGISVCIDSRVTCGKSHSPPRASLPYQQQKEIVFSGIIMLPTSQA